MTEQLPFASSTGGYRYQPARGAYGAGADRRRRRARPTYTHMGEVKMASFETIFRIPSSHVLKAKFHSYGAGVPESWSHEEYDGGGEFVARYESCVHTNDDGVRTSDGWKKFDFEDVLVAAEGDLPI
jgi:hypothetical protein